MKKTLLALVIAGIVGTGGYMAINQATGSIAEKQLTTFIQENKNKPITITSLEFHPLIEKADWTIIDKQENKVHSVFLLKLAGGKKALEIPLNSEIIRGETQYNGKSYGFGKIITRPDLSQFKELPESINNDTFTSTQYIALDGDITSVENISPIEIKNASGRFSFAGLTAITDLSLLNIDAYETHIESPEATTILFVNEDASSEREHLEISPIKLSFKIDKDGNYIGDSSSFFIQLLNEKTKESIARTTFSKATYSGIYKKTEGLITPINNGKITFDSITFKGEETGENQLNNLRFEGGIYDVGNDLVDVRGTFSTDIDSDKLKASGLYTMMRRSGMKVTPTHFNFEYEISHLGYDFINTYYTVMSNLTNNKDSKIPKETRDKLINSIQKTDTKLSSSFEIKSEEGNANAKGSIALSEKGKKATAQAIVAAIEKQSPEQAIQLISADGHIVIDKSFADNTDLSMVLQLMLGLTPKEEKYTIEVKIEEGHATVNGQPMM